MVSGVKSCPGAIAAPEGKPERLTLAYVTVAEHALLNAKALVLTDEQLVFGVRGFGKGSRGPDTNDLCATVKVAGADRAGDEPLEYLQRHGRLGSCVRGG